MQSVQKFLPFLPMLGYFCPPFQKMGINQH